MRGLLLLSACSFYIPQDGSLLQAGSEAQLQRGPSILGKQTGVVEVVQNYAPSACTLLLFFLAWGGDEGVGCFRHGFVMNGNLLIGDDIAHVDDVVLPPELT